MKQEEFEAIVSGEQLRRFVDVLEAYIKGGKAAAKNVLKCLSEADAQLFCAYLKAVKEENFHHGTD